MTSTKHTIPHFPFPNLLLALCSLLFVGCDLFYIPGEPPTPPAPPVIGAAPRTLSFTVVEASDGYVTLEYSPPTSSLLPLIPPAPSPCRSPKPPRTSSRSSLRMARVRSTAGTSARARPYA